MKKLIFLILFLCGCMTPCKKCPPIVNDTMTVNCENSPSLWWGEKGDSPADNDLWKCYDWILEVQNNWE